MADTAPRRADTVPLDLAVILLMAGLLALAWVAGWSGLRSFLGFAAALFVPGHLLGVALFPYRRQEGQEDLERRAPTGVERVGLAIVFSVTLLGFTGLLLVSTPQGLTDEAVAAVIGVSSGLLWVAAVARWYQWPRDQRYAFTLRPGGQSTPAEVGLRIGAVLSAILVVAVAIPALTDEPRETLTEFFVEGPDGRSICYPATHDAEGFHPSESDLRQHCQPTVDHIVLGVANREGESRDYRIRVSWTQLNATTQVVDSVLVAQLDVHAETMPIEVDPDRVEGAVRIQYPLPPPAFQGSQKLVFELHRTQPGPEAAAPYRALELAIEAA